MSDIKCDVKKLYAKVDCTDSSETHLVEISWNNRDITGVDIRKFDIETGRYGKGIRLSYEGLANLLVSAVECGLVTIEDVKTAMEKWSNKTYDENDFEKLFERFNDELRDFSRDKYGNLTSKDGSVIYIESRKKNEH